MKPEHRYIDGLMNSKLPISSILPFFLLAYPRCLSQQSRSRAWLPYTPLPSWLPSRASTWPSFQARPVARSGPAHLYHTAARGDNFQSCPRQNTLRAERNRTCRTTREGQLVEHRCCVIVSPSVKFVKRASKLTMGSYLTASK